MSTTIVDSSGNAIQISLGQFKRPLSFGANWNRIRITFRGRVETSSNLGSTPRFYCGLCNGAGGMVSDGSTGNFVGLQTNRTALTYSSNVLYYATGTGGGAWRVLHRYNGSTEDVYDPAGGDALVNCWGIKAGATTDKAIHIIEMTRTGTDVVTFGYFVPGINSYGTSIVTAETAASTVAFSEAAVPVKTSWSMQTVGSVATGETTYGGLDALNISWQVASPAMTIDDIGVSRLA